MRVSSAADRQLDDLMDPAGPEAIETVGGASPDPTPRVREANGRSGPGANRSAPEAIP